MFKIVEMVFWALVAAALVAGAIMFFKASRRMTNSDFKAQLRKIPLLRIGALILAVVLALLFSAVGYLGDNQSATATLSLNYDEASLGQNANGTRYNMSEIICDEVLENAIYEGALNLTVEELRDCLYVEALVQGNSREPSQYHIATEFVMCYTANAKTMQYDAETITQLVSEAYKDYYFSKYVSSFEIDQKEMEEEIKGLDYMDAAEYLMKKRNVAINYLSDLQLKNNSFVAEDGTTFAAITKKLEQLGSVQINANLIPFIIQNGLSKEINQYRGSLYYVNTMLSFDRDREAVSYNVTNNAILRYAEEMTRVVLVPTWDEKGKYYMGRTKVGIDELSEQAMDYSDSRVSLEEDIQNNVLILNKMGVEGANSDISKKAADDMIANIVKDLVSYGEAAHRVGQEYYANQMNQCITITVSGASLMNQIKNAVVLLVAAYIALAFLAAARDFSGGKEVEAEDGRE